MSYMLDAACLCNTGKVRKNNEDNFFFDNRCLEVNNTGLKHPVSMAKPLRRELCVAVFDGMGGENFGEYASSAAAECMQHMTRKQNNQTTTSNFPCNFNFAVSNMNRFNQGIYHG